MIQAGLKVKIFLFSASAMLEWKVFVTTGFTLSFRGFLRTGINI